MFSFFYAEVSFAFNPCLFSHTSVPDGQTDQSRLYCGSCLCTVCATMAKIDSSGTVNLPFDPKLPSNKPVFPQPPCLSLNSINTANNLKITQVEHACSLWASCFI